MSRQYIVPSWVGAAEDHSEWSGASPDDRKRKSQNIGHYLPNGKANTGKYADTPVKTKDSASELEFALYPSQKMLNRLDDLEKRVLINFKQSGDYDAYTEAMHSIRLRRERAYKALCKAKGWKYTNDSPTATKQATNEHRASDGKNTSFGTGVLFILLFLVFILSF